MIRVFPSKIIVSFVLLSPIIFLGCSQKGSDTYMVRPVHREKPVIEQPVETPKLKIAEKVDGFSLDFNPKVDILFVIDNSDSMKEHQVNLSKNISRFVSEFSKYKMIDFHIGATSVWDTTTFSNKQKRFKIGELRPIRDPQTKGELLGVRYVHRDQTNFLGLLESSLNLGVEPLKDGGPEFEEVFSVIGAVIQNKDPQFNVGFLRPDAHLVVVIITDADDSTRDYGPDQMADDLLKSKGNDLSKISVMSVLVSANDPIKKKDFGLRGTSDASPVKLITFTKKFSDFGAGKLMGINSSDYGSMLAQMGKLVKERAMRKVIDLDILGPKPVFPQIGTIKVTYGNQVIEANPKTGYTYDASSNEIIINPGVDFKPQEGAKIGVTFTALDPTETATERWFHLLRDKKINKFV